MNRDAIRLTKNFENSESFGEICVETLGMKYQTLSEIGSIIF